jgi:hypothetical protein
VWGQKGCVGDILLDVEDVCVEVGDFFPVGERNGSCWGLSSKKQATALWLGRSPVEKRIFSNGRLTMRL